jgi:hypothetical protein
LLGFIWKMAKKRALPFIGWFYICIAALAGNKCYPINIYCYPSNILCYPSNILCYPINMYCYPTNSHSYPSNMHCYPINLHSYPSINNRNPTNLYCYPKNGATTNELGIMSVVYRMASIDNGEAFKDNRIAIVG